MPKHIYDQTYIKYPGGWPRKSQENRLAAQGGGSGYFRMPTRGVSDISTVGNALFREQATEGAAFANLAFDFKPGIVSQQHVLDDGEPQAGAARGARARRIHAVEALRQVRKMFRRDAFAGVADDEFRAVTRGAPRQP